MRIIDFFDQGAAYYADAPALVDTRSGNQLSYGQAARVSRQVAQVLREMGFEKGAHVAVLAPNSDAAFTTLLGVFRAELVWLPLNPRNPIEVNADLLARFDASLLLYHSDFAHLAPMLAAKAPTLRTAVCIDGAQSTSLTSRADKAEGSFEAGEEDPDAALMIAPTGGTTGKSKGVVITHRNVETAFANFSAHFRYDDGARHLVVAPMTHTAGLVGFMHFARGGLNVIMDGFDAPAVCAAIDGFAITHLFLPPTALYALLECPTLANHSYRSLKHLLVGAAPSASSKIREAIKVFGPVLTEAFGQTESPLAICLKAPWDYLRADGTIVEERLQSVGRPGVFNKVSILGDNGCEMPRGEKGEICVRGPLVSPGYYKPEDESSGSVRDGWLHTGDVGVMDSDGYVTIVDRLKDVIITGGFNVYPNLIEQILNTHPSVLDCAVIGVPDDKWGEAVCAAVQLKPHATASSDELAKLVREKLGAVHTPKRIEFMSSLPRSPVGKVLKAELRKPYWAGKQRAVN